MWPAGTKRHAFPNGVTFAVDHAGRYCETAFPDGTRVPAAPEAGDRQAKLAAELGYPGVWPLVWHHEFLHSYQALPGVSRVLWDVAHGRPGDTAAHWDEEGRVLDLQRAVCAGRAGAGLTEVLAGLGNSRGSNYRRPHIAAKAESGDRPMREINTHKVNGCNELLSVGAIDAPGPGGANHEYMVTLPSGSAFHNVSIDTDASSVLIPFQKGAISEAGANGVTNELLIALVIDRLQSFQRGPYACRENALALTKLEEAMHWLQHRTRERVARGVEGTNEK